VNNSTILILIFVYCTYSTAGAIVQISPVVSEYGQYVITTSFETWKKKHFRWIIFIFIKKKNVCVLYIQQDRYWQNLICRKPGSSLEKTNTIIIEVCTVSWICRRSLKQHMNMQRISNLKVTLPHWSKFMSSVVAL